MNNNLDVEKIPFYIATMLVLFLLSSVAIALFCIVFDRTKISSPDRSALNHIRTLEKQNKLLHQGWDQCVQDYEKLMNDYDRVNYKKLKNMTIKGGK